MINFVKLIWVTILNNIETMSWLLGLQVFLAVLILVVMAFEEKPTTR
jgi:hypothetical protein